MDLYRDVANAYLVEIHGCGVNSLLTELYVSNAVALGHRGHDIEMDELFATRGHILRKER